MEQMVTRRVPCARAWIRIWTLILLAGAAASASAAPMSATEKARDFFDYRIERKALEGETVLARDGKARYAIVVADDAPVPTRFAAEELKRFLDRVSGADFAIVAEAPEGLAPLLVGDSPAARAAGAPVEDLKRDGYRIVVKPDVIAIAGRDGTDERAKVLYEVLGDPIPEDTPNGEAYKIVGDPVWDFERGSLYGVYRFLEELGVRWFFPGPKGETVPSNPSPKLPAFSLIEEPAFVLRVFGRTFWYPSTIRREGTMANPAEYEELGWHGKANRLWLLRMRTSSPWFAFNHRPPRHKWIHRFGKTHPEYFAVLPDGERNLSRKAGGRHGGQLCYTEPGVYEETLKDIDAFFGGRRAASRGIPEGSHDQYELNRGWSPNASYGDTFSLLPMDGYRGCHCERCAALAPEEPSAWNRHSRMVWPFIARVAREVEQRHPGRILTCLAYSSYTEIPDGVRPLPDNVMVGVCPRYLNKTYNLVGEDGYSQYMALVRRHDTANEMPLLFWLHHLFHWKRPHHAGAPMILTGFFKRLIGDLAPHGRMMFMEQDPSDVLLESPNRYAVLRLLYNPGLDIEELMDDYVARLYGPAAPVMRTLYRDMENLSEREAKAGPSLSILGVDGGTLWTRLITQEVLDDYERRVAEARRLAEGTPAAAQVDLFARYCLEGMKQGRKSFLSAAGLTGEKLDFDKVGLPPALEAEAERVIQVYAEDFGYRPSMVKSHAKLVKDPVSSTGRAACVVVAKAEHERKNDYLLTEKSPFLFGVYDRGLGHNVGRRLVRPDEVPNDGYNLYRLEDLVMPTDSMAFLFWSWHIQLPLTAAIENPAGRRFDMIVSARFDGPSFPHGDPEARDALYVDRLFFVEKKD